MRDSSFELLRIVLMVFITIHHFIVLGLGLLNLHESCDYNLILSDSQINYALFFNAFCVCAVDCFVLISGYFGIKTTKKRYVSLLATLIFYVLLLAILPNLLVGNFKMALYWSLFLSHTPYWFIVDYLFLMVFAPMLNIAFEKLDKRTINYILIGLTLICCYFGFIQEHPANKNGYTIIQFIFMYYIGRWIKCNDFNISMTRSIGMYIGGAILTATSSIFLYHIGLGNYVWRCFYYNSPSVILSAVGIFMIFKNISFESRIVNKYAKSALAIYMVQSSPALYRIQYSSIQKIYLSAENVFFGGGIYLILISLAITLVIVILLCDQLRVKLFQMLKI